MLAAVIEHAERNRRAGIVVGRRNVAIGRAAVMNERLRLVDRWLRSSCMDHSLRYRSVQQPSPVLPADHPRGRSAENQADADQERDGARSALGRWLRNWHKALRAIESVRAEIMATKNAPGLVSGAHVSYSNPVRISRGKEFTRTVRNGTGKVGRNSRWFL